MPDRPRRAGGSDRWRPQARRSMRTAPIRISGGPAAGQRPPLTLDGGSARLLASEAAVDRQGRGLLGEIPRLTEPSRSTSSSAERALGSLAKMGEIA